MIARDDDDVAEFGELYFRETGVRLTSDRARLVAERLVELVARVDGIGRRLDPPPRAHP